MLIFGGMILDKMGVRFTGLMSTVIMVIGVGIKYWAIASDFGGASVTIFGSVISSQVLWAAIGYAIFGVGIEIAGITVSKIIVKWFKGKELALAMGLEMACARIGTALALSITPLLAEEFGSVSMPILLGLLLLCIGMISFVVFVVMDTKRDQGAERFRRTRRAVPLPRYFRDCPDQRILVHCDLVRAVLFGGFPVFKICAGSDVQ